jgi:hypothetical protein
LWGYRAITEIVWLPYAEPDGKLATWETKQAMFVDLFDVVAPAQPECECAQMMRCTE